MAVSVQRAATLGKLLLLAVFLSLSLTPPAQALARSTTAAPDRFALPLEGGTPCPAKTAYCEIFRSDPEPNIGFVAHANPVNYIDPSGNDIISAISNAAMQGYVRTMVFVAQRPILSRVIGLVAGLVVASQIDPNALQGLPQMQSLGALQKAEVRFLELMKRGPIYQQLNKQLKGSVDHYAGHAFQKWLKKNVLKNIVGENVSISRDSKHNVDFELSDVFVEAKHAIDFDAAQLRKLAARAKEVGKEFWYVFVKRPDDKVVEKIKNQVETLVGFWKKEISCAIAC